METDVRESVNDCILASGEGHGSRGETLHPICAARPVSSSERSVLLSYTLKVNGNICFLVKCVYQDNHAGFLGQQNQPITGKIHKNWCYKESLCSCIRNFNLRTFVIGLYTA
jgi:hypothetical protein